MITRPLMSAERLDTLPTLSEGYTCDLKWESANVRWWLHRTSIEDGEPYRNTVTIEIRSDGCWHDVLTYDGDDPDNEESWLWTEWEHLIDDYQEA